MTASTLVFFLSSLALSFSIYRLFYRLNYDIYKNRVNIRHFSFEVSFGVSALIFMANLIPITLYQRVNATEPFFFVTVMFSFLVAFSFFLYNQLTYTKLKRKMKQSFLDNAILLNSEYYPADFLTDVQALISTHAAKKDFHDSGAIYPLRDTGLKLRIEAMLPFDLAFSNKFFVWMNKTSKGYTFDKSNLNLEITSIAIIDDDKEVNIIKFMRTIGEISSINNITREHMDMYNMITL